MKTNIVVCLVALATIFIAVCFTSRSQFLAPQIEIQSTEYRNDTFYFSYLIKNTLDETVTMYKVSLEYPEHNFDPSCESPLGVAKSINPSSESDDLVILRPKSTRIVVVPASFLHMYSLEPGKDYVSLAYIHFVTGNSTYADSVLRIDLGRIIIAHPQNENQDD